ncbi:F-box/LRR-repeat protein 5 isoform X1 [Chiloscyllium punctatum]|uniref:F-box/LRR-repeat protein 5 isoform X1 n=1 Tax=Chiloscyllium punctatum TaxID=137246 RepID=UPI003B632E55
MEYFSYEELKDIKVKVLARHGHVDTVEVLKELQLRNQTEDQQKLDKNSPGSNRTPPGTEPEPQANNTHVSQLPPEVLLKIFAYLNPLELCRSRQVNARWAKMAGAASLWRHLYPVAWARGDWYNGPPGTISSAPDDPCESEGEDHSPSWDEDADIDESEESRQEVWPLRKAQREAQLLQAVIHYLLPQVGAAVRTLVLAYSSTLSSQMVRQILNSCPRLQYLDLTQTAVTDSAFNRCRLGSCRSLQHLDLSGCERVTDAVLHHLSRALGELPEDTEGEGAQAWRSECTWAPHGCHPCPPGAEDEEEEELGTQGGDAGQVWLLPEEELLDIEDAGGLRVRGQGPGTPRREALPPPPGSIAARCIRDSECPLARAPCGHTLCAGGTRMRTHGTVLPPPPQCNKMVRTQGPGAGRWRGRVEPDARSLRFLSLSGCFQITDHGLRALTLHGGLPFLEHLDLSGCLLITGPGLQELVSVCPALRDEYFFYCDNISGPHATTASGCQNLQCSVRACCRSGE